MGLGSTAKKVQALADRAEQLYTQLTAVREEVDGLRGTVERTGDRVDELARQNREQRALLVALAEEGGIDVDAVLTEATIEDAETTTGSEGAGDGSPADGAESSTGGAGSSTERSETADEPTDATAE